MKRSSKDAYVFEHFMSPVFCWALCHLFFVGHSRSMTARPAKRLLLTKLRFLVSCVYSPTRRIDGAGFATPAVAKQNPTIRQALGSATLAAHTIAIRGDVPGRGCRSRHPPHAVAERAIQRLRQRYARQNCQCNDGDDSHCVSLAVHAQTSVSPQPTKVQPNKMFASMIAAFSRCCRR